MNLEFQFEQAPPVVFHIEELNAKSRAIYEKARARAKKYLVSEAELLESIMEADQDKLYEKLGLGYLTTFCVKHLGLDETVAGVLVRVARKSQVVPELGKAVMGGDVSISNARTITSVITKENQTEWIEKAKTLSKNKLEREVAQVSPTKAKPEKARHIGNGRVQIVINLSEEQYEERCRIQELVSKSLGRTANDSEVEAEMMKVYSYHKDPVLKAKRVAERKSKEQDASQERSPTQSTPAAVTHAVNLKDSGRCRAKLPDGTECGETRWTEHHHIIPKWMGGKDEPSNMITLCSAHHRLWHKRLGF